MWFFRSWRTRFLRYASHHFFRGATRPSNDRFTFRSPSTEKDPEPWLSEEADGNGLGRPIPEPTIRDLTRKIDDPALEYTEGVGASSNVYRCRLKQPDGKGTMVS